MSASVNSYKCFTPVITALYDDDVADAAAAAASHDVDDDENDNDTSRFLIITLNQQVLVVTSVSQQLANV